MDFTAVITEITGATADLAPVCAAIMGVVVAIWAFKQAKRLIG